MAGGSQESELQRAYQEIQTKIHLEKTLVPVFFEMIKGKKIKKKNWRVGHTLVPSRIEWKNGTYYVMYGIDDQGVEVWTFLDRKECTFKHWQIIEN